LSSTGSTIGPKIFRVKAAPVMVDPLGVNDAVNLVVVMGWLAFLKDVIIQNLQDTRRGTAERHLDWQFDRVLEQPDKLRECVQHPHAHPMRFKYSASSPTPTLSSRYRPLPSSIKSSLPSV
jgi:hypothetical protein